MQRDRVDDGPEDKRDPGEDGGGDKEEQEVIGGGVLSGEAGDQVGAEDSEGDRDGERVLQAGEQGAGLQDQHAEGGEEPAHRRAQPEEDEAQEHHDRHLRGQQPQHRLQPQQLQGPLQTLHAGILAHPQVTPRPLRFICEPSFREVKSTMDNP